MPPCTKPTGPEYNYIRFTLDGLEMDAEEIVILNFGGPDWGEENPWITAAPVGDAMWFVGEYCFHTATPTEVVLGIYGWLYPYTPREYIGTYGGIRHSYR